MENRTLPPELIREILLRLPVRSVSRCKCVCKSWFSMVSDPQFGNSHYYLAAAPLDKSCVAVYSLLPLQSLSRKLMNYDNYDSLPNRAKIFGSCRGFILLYYEMGRDLIIWNPLTRARKRLLNFETTETRGFLYGFGYDTATDDYLLMMIQLMCKNEIQVFSFKTNSRNTINIDVPYIENSVEIGSLFNGALHWLVFSKEKGINVIIAFDLIQRSLSEIPLPDHLAKKMYEMFSLRVVGGCIGIGGLLTSRRSNDGDMDDERI